MVQNSNVGNRIAAARPPLLNQSIAQNIDCIEDGLVVPPTGERAGPGPIRAGVLDASGAFVNNSITFRGNLLLNRAPEMPAEEDIKYMAGNYMFGGMMFGHFGHSLVETMARLWAIEHIDAKIDGILFIPKTQHHVQRILEIYTPLYQMFGVRVAMYNLEGPVCVDRIYVPQQGFGIFDMIEGAPEFRDYIHKHAGKSVPASGPEDIYVSRTKLKLQRGGILGESYIENHLIEEGYTPIYPEKMTFEEQIAAYKAARRIIASDGSPLHMAAMVGRSDQKVACISRRHGGIDEMFARQFKAFQDIDLTIVNAVRYSWVPSGKKVPAFMGIGETRFSEVHKMLYDAGFISQAEPWVDLNQEERRKYLLPLEELSGDVLIRTRG